LAVAGGVGFIFGGGAHSRIGLAVLTLVGRIALRGAATNFILGLVTGNHDNQGAGRAYDSQRKYRAMETMTTTEQIAAIQVERDDALHDLRDTLAEVNEKVGQAGGKMRPDHVIESHPVGASLIAGALGFQFGSIVNSRGAGPIVIVALLGVAISKHGSRDET
jgi:hypothetical protein